MKKEQMYQKIGLRPLRTVLTLVLLMIVMTISAAAESDDPKIKAWENCGQSETGLIMFKETHEGSYRLGSGTFTSNCIAYGLKDASGNIVVAAQYNVFKYINGMIFATKHSCGGLTSDSLFNVVFNNRGESIFPRAGDSMELHGIKYIEECNVFVVSRYGKSRNYRLYDGNLNLLYSEYYDGIEYFGEDLLEFKISYFDGYMERYKHGLYKMGKGLIIPVEHPGLGLTWYNGYIKVGTDDLRCGLYDVNGNIVIPSEYAYFGDVYEDFFVVGKFKRPEYRELLISRGYDQVKPTTVIDDETALYMGVIDKNGNTIIPFEYDNIVFSPEDGVVELGLWTGKTEEYKIGNTVAGWYYIYNWESLPLSELETRRPIFSDVPTTSYYNEPVRWAVEKGITTGTSDKTFSPDQTCTTAQILTFLWRAYGCPEPTIANPFTNVSADQYFYKAALWAYENGMISGTEFDGSAPCTRARTMLFMWQAAGSPAVRGITSFTDVPADALYAQAVAWAVQNGITTGTSETTFSPDQTCTRGQIVTFLHRAFGA